MKQVYLVRAGELQYKVGIASNIVSRLKAMQTSNGHVIELITVHPVANAVEVERELHRSLAQAKLNGGNEWFELTPKQAIDLAILINTYPSTDINELEEIKELVTDQIAKQSKLYRKIENLFAQLGLKKEEHIKADNSINQPAKVPKIDTDKDAEIYKLAIELIKDNGKASTSLLQRKLSIGYGRAARLIEKMELGGYIGPPNGAKARVVIVPTDREVEASKSVVASPTNL